MGWRNPIVAGVELVRTAIQSLNFVANSAGWQIQNNGNAQFNNATLTGTLKVVGTGGQTITINIIAGTPFITLSTGAAEEGTAATLAALITNPGVSEILRLFLDGPVGSVHNDWTAVWLSSAAKDGSTVAGGSLVYTDTGGSSHLFGNWGPKGFRMGSAYSGDSNVYQGERQSIVLNGSITATSSFQQVGAAFFLGVGQYVVEGQAMISPTAAGGNAVLQFAGGGGLVVGSSGITWSETLFGNPATPGSWSFTDPAIGSSFTSATLTTARRLVTFRGTINVTTAGTCALFVEETGGGAFAVNSRTTCYELYPVGP